MLISSRFITALFMRAKILDLGAEETAQWSRALTALAEDLSSVPSNHVEWLTTACDPRHSIPSAFPLGTSTHMHVTPTKTDRQTD